jgi:hypothetical protein
LCDFVPDIQKNLSSITISDDLIAESLPRALVQDTHDFSIEG